MKKLLILALVALVAGSAFATTDPAFSGEFDFFVGFDFAAEEADFGDAGEATINLNGVVDEYSTVNAELSAETVDGVAANLELGNFTLTTDITGALGVDGPVGVSIEWGYQDAEPANYAEVAGYNDTTFGNDTGDYVGTTITLDIASIKIIGTIFPSTYTDWEGLADEAVGFVEIQYAMDAVSANVFFTYDPNATADVMGLEIGATASYVTDELEVGFGTVFYDMDVVQQLRLGAAFLYNITDAFAAGLAYATTNMLDGNFGATTAVALNTEYAVNDMFGLYASFLIKDFTDITFALDAGVEIGLGGVTYTIGYDYAGAGFKTPDWALDEGLYFIVSASF